MKLLRLWFCEKYFTIWLIWSWWAIIVYAIDRIWRKVRSCRGLVLKPSIDVVRQWSWFRHLCSLVLIGFFNNYCLYLFVARDVLNVEIKVDKVHCYWTEINKNYLYKNRYWRDAENKIISIKRSENWHDKMSKIVLTDYAAIFMTSFYISLFVVTKVGNRFICKHWFMIKLHFYLKLNHALRFTNQD